MRPVRVRLATRRGIVGKLAYDVEQGGAVGVVEEVSNLYAVGVELIRLEQFKRLPGARCTRAQHSIDRDLLPS